MTGRRTRKFCVADFTRISLNSLSNSISPVVIDVCRFPQVGEVVMVTVKDITDVGAYVSLLEYDGMEGMVLLSELSRKRIRSINKLIRVGRQEVVAVLRVDEDKGRNCLLEILLTSHLSLGYIDLSKRKVEPSDIKKCEDRYNKAKVVHSVLRHVAEQHSSTLEEMYRVIGWPLYRKHGHAYDAFELALGESEVDIFEGLNVPEEMQSNLLAYIKRRMARQPVKIRCDIEVTCSTYEGIDAIKGALMEGEALSTSDCPVRIKLIAPPMYVMTCMTLDRDAGIETLNKAVECIASSIRGKGGSLEVKMAAKAVSLREETELQAMLDRLALENEEVDGDAPDDS